MPSRSFPTPNDGRTPARGRSMKNVVIAGYARSPFTPAKKGELARVRPDEIAAQVVRALVERTGVEARRHRGPDRRLRLPRGRAGVQRGAPHRLPRRAAAVGRRHDGEPLLRLVDAGGAHGGRRDPDGRRRAVRLRRRRVDDPHADGRLQSAAEPRPVRDATRRPSLRWARRRRTWRSSTRSRASVRRSSRSNRSAAPPPRPPPASSTTRSCRSPARHGTVSRDGCPRADTDARRARRSSSSPSTRTGR